METGNEPNPVARYKISHEVTKTRRITKGFNLPSAKNTVFLCLRVLVVNDMVFQQFQFDFF